MLGLFIKFSVLDDDVPPRVNAYRVFSSCDNSKISVGAAHYEYEGRSE